MFKSISFQQTFEGWRRVYLIAMGVYVFGTILWTTLGTADVQHWDTYWLKEDLKAAGTSFDISIQHN